jgi:hypothetical protein
MARYNYELERLDDELEICPMTKQQLALLYSADLTPHSAVNRLMRWIGQCEPLLKALDETGYKKYNRIFSPKQVALIFQYLGEP